MRHEECGSQNDRKVTPARLHQVDSLPVINESSEVAVQESGMEEKVDDHISPMCLVTWRHRRYQAELAYKEVRERWDSQV